jgi:uncharacterized protein YbbC (DUF1343 family)
VSPGIDVLLADSLHLVSGRRVGLLTNQTGVDLRGTSDVDRVLAAGVSLTALFSPEHGFRGALNVDNIGNTVDSATGLPIYSLYGNVRAPTPSMLSGIDVLLIDLQDIGARTYTYISTALLAIEAAARSNVSVIVLDRPNPIGGELVQGPILDTAYASFVGMLPLPLRHGMTLGELARFGVAHRKVTARLTVVPAAGWTRATWFDATGLPWVRPSPSMPDLESATHYPGMVLFEATNLSVGRGTPIAFQVVGAPWLDARAVARAVGMMPGVALNDTTVMPVAPPDGKYAGVSIRGVRLRVVDRAVYDPAQLAVRLLAAVRSLHRDSLRINARGLDQRAGSAALREALDAGRPADEIARTWTPGLESFRRAREPFLLYR